MLFKLALVLSAIVALGLAGEECGIRGPGLRYRVIGGRDTKPGEFPWMVTTGGCGASLINNQWLVTAAHCGGSSNKEFKVGLGVFDKAKYTKDNDQLDAVTVIASKRIVHPDFGDHLKNDVAVIKLKEPLDLTGEHKHLSPVCLPEANMPKEALNGTICTATGWGQTTFGDRGHDMPKGSFPLQQVDVPIVDSKTCLKMFPDDYFEELKICAGGNKKGWRISLLR